MKKKILKFIILLCLFLVPVFFTLSQKVNATGGSSTLMIENQSNSIITFNANSTYSTNITQNIPAAQSILIDKNDSAIYSYQILDNSSGIILDEGNIAPGQFQLIYNPNSANNPNVCLHSESNQITNWTFQNSYLAYQDNLTNWSQNASSNVEFSESISIYGGLSVQSFSNWGYGEYIKDLGLNYQTSFNNSMMYDEIFKIPSKIYSDHAIQNLTFSVLLKDTINTNGGTFNVNTYADNSSLDYSYITPSEYFSSIQSLTSLQTLNYFDYSNYLYIVSIPHYQSNIYLNSSLITAPASNNQYLYYEINNPNTIFNYDRLNQNSILFNQSESINMSKSLTSPLNLVKGDVITFSYYSQNQASGILKLGNENPTFSGSGYNKIQYTLKQSETLNQLSAIINSAGNNEFNITNFTINSIPTSTSPSISFLVNPYSSKNIFVEPNNFQQYMITVSDLTGKILEIFNTNINSTSSITNLFYTSIGSTTCQILYSNSLGDAISFNNFRTQIQYSLLNQTNTEYIQTNTFIADQNSSVIVSTYDIFGDLLKTSDFITNSSPATYLPVKINLNILTIHSYLQSKTQIELIKNSNYYNETIFPDETLSFNLYSGIYFLNYTDDSDKLQSLSIDMNESKSIELNSTFTKVYFAGFSDDALGINAEDFRFYLNGERQSLFNAYMINGSANIKIMDYFNATLFDKTILFQNILGFSDEYNMYLPIYTLILNNNYTDQMKYEISRSDSNINFTQVIKDHLSWQFEANVTYTIKVFYLNGTLAQNRTVLLNSNNKIENFGFYSQIIPANPSELHATLFNALLTIIILEGVVIVFTPIAIVYINKRTQKKKRVPYLERRRIEREKIHF